MPDIVGLIKRTVHSSAAINWPLATPQRRTNGPGRAPTTATRHHLPAERMFDTVLHMITEAFSLARHRHLRAVFHVLRYAVEAVGIIYGFQHEIIAALERPSRHNHYTLLIQL